MMHFSIGTGLERVDRVGLELELSQGWSASSGRWTPLQNKKERGSAGASPVPAPMPKSVPPY